MVDPDTLITRLQELIADAARRVELETDPVLRVYWQGVRFGLETALNELQAAVG